MLFWTNRHFFSILNIFLVYLFYLANIILNRFYVTNVKIYLKNKNKNYYQLIFFITNLAYLIFYLIKKVRNIYF